MGSRATDSKTQNSEKGLQTTPCSREKYSPREAHALTWSLTQASITFTGGDVSEGPGVAVVLVPVASQGPSGGGGSLTAEREVR